MGREEIRGFLFPLRSVEETEFTELGDWRSSRLIGLVTAAERFSTTVNRVLTSFFYRPEFC